MYDFDWNVWLPMFILIFGWGGAIYMAEKRKDVIFAFCSIFFGLALFANPLARSTFVIVEYPLVIIFTVISIYEFFIIALKR
jgi:hypothetical protein